jgi:hypothetical protein
MTRYLGAQGGRKRPQRVHFNNMCAAAESNNVTHTEYPFLFQAAYILVRESGVVCVSLSGGTTDVCRIYILKI